MKNYIYIRCNYKKDELDSSELQKKIDLQKEKIKSAGYSYQKEFMDCEILNSKAEKKNLKLMLDVVKEGDVILIDQYSRLGHNIQDLFNIMNSLKSKNVNLISIQENLNLLSKNGEFTLKVIEDIKKYESTAKKEKTNVILEGIRKAKENGSYKNRKSIPRTELMNFYIDKYLHSNKYEPYKIDDLVKDSGLKKSMACRFIKIRIQELKNSKINETTNEKDKTKLKNYGRNKPSERESKES
jgi:DNA invertase Pin-like site-specific DNA recombinase